MIRETLMLESLCQAQDLTTKIESIEVDSVKPANSLEEFNIYIENIIEEYMYIGSTEEIINFITNECKDLENKNIFCKELITQFFNNDKKSKLICDLFYELINKKILFKSNISRGLILFLESTPNNKIVTSLMEYFLKLNYNKLLF
jgi:hypothetical protein